MQTVPFGNVSPSVWTDRTLKSSAHFVGIFGARSKVAEFTRGRRPPDTESWCALPLGRAGAAPAAASAPLTLSPALPGAASHSRPWLSPGVCLLAAFTSPNPPFCPLFLLSSKFRLLRFWGSAEPLTQLLN